MIYSKIDLILNQDVHRRHQDPIVVRFSGQRCENIECVGVVSEQHEEVVRKRGWPLSQTVAARYTEVPFGISHTGVDNRVEISLKKEMTLSLGLAEIRLVKIK